MFFFGSFFLSVFMLYFSYSVVYSLLRGEVSECVALLAIYSCSIAKCNRYVYILNLFHFYCKKKKNNFFLEKEKSLIRTIFSAHRCSILPSHLLFISTQTIYYLTHLACPPAVRVGLSYQAPSSEFVSSLPAPSSVRSRVLPGKDRSHHRPLPP